MTGPSVAAASVLATAAAGVYVGNEVKLLVTVAINDMTERKGSKANRIENEYLDNAINLIKARDVSLK